MSSTYTKTFVVCPHCEAHTNSSIDHLEHGRHVGPWYCNDCGGGFEFVMNGADSTVTKHVSRNHRVLDLLVLEPQTKPVYFVVEGSRWERVPGDLYDSPEYFYEEHSCPTNWITDTVMLAFDGDTDPHGLFKFVRSAPLPENYRIDGIDDPFSLSSEEPT